MKTKTYIHIQEPCHENWAQMSAAEKGRFCHSCAKTVTDFSLMTDAEILAYLGSNRGSTCGRFSTDQLDRAIRMPATPAKKTIWAWMLSLCLPFVAAIKLNAQKKSEPVRTEQGLGSKPAKQLPEVTAVRPEISDTSRLKTKDRDTAQTALDADIQMEPMVMGLIIAYDKVTPADTVSTFVTKTINNEMFRVYPNPAVKGKKLSVELKRKGSFSLQLLDQDSKMILQKEVSASAKGQVVFIDLPATLHSGGYYIRLVQAGTNKQFVDKLVVK